MKNRRDFLKTASASTLAMGLLGSKAWGAKKNPIDTSPEIDVSLGSVHKGTPEIDLQLLDSYGKPPAKIRQFFIEARDIFEENKYGTFSDNSDLEKCAGKHGIELYGGPMLGNVGADKVWIWLRTLQPAKVEIQTVKGAGQARTFGPVQTARENDLTAIVKIAGLEADTEYHYRVLVDGREVDLDRKTRFTTLPAAEHATCRIAFGSCFHKAGIHNPHLLSQIERRGNRAMLLLGDIAADGRKNEVGLLRSDYLLRDLSLAWRNFSASVPIYAAWDDWDYFHNDISGIPKKFTADDVRAVRKVWLQNWNNPGYGENGAGIYFHTRVGPADLIMLDTRSLRKERPRLKNAYLGDKQTAWLKRELLKCQGPFTIISSGTMWSDNISNGKDSWGKWDPAGREELFRFIEAEHVPGVLLLSGDRHGARGIKIKRPSGYCLHEFEPATLGGMTGPPAWGKDRDNQMFGHAKLRAFGEFTFETRPQDPVVTFRLVDETGQVIEEIAMRQSELTG